MHAYAHHVAMDVVYFTRRLLSFCSLAQLQTFLQNVCVYALHVVSGPHAMV